MKVLEPRLKPKVIISDFKMAFIKAAQKGFEGVNIHGYFFHYSQAMYRKIQFTSLQTSFLSNGDYCMHLNNDQTISTCSSK